MNHSRISASKLERIALCPASYRLEDGIEEKTNPMARRGTLIHKLSEDLILNQYNKDFDYECDEEMQEIAKGYADFILSYQPIMDELSVEEDLQPYLSTIHKDLGGYSDAIILAGADLHIFDLKTGFIKVNPKDNKQLMAYALGAWLKYKDAKIERIFLHIYQPMNKSNPHEISVQDIKDFQLKIADIANEANNPFAEMNPDPKACKYCKAKLTCPALKEKANMNAKTDFETTTIPMNELLEMAELCAIFSDAVKNEAKKLLENGASIEGWTLKEGKKMQKWSEDASDYFKKYAQAWDLKSVAAIKKLKIDVPENMVIETRASPSLTRIG
jgi:hypothetical protein